MLARREQENFQLIVITHDEKWALDCYNLQVEAPMSRCIEMLNRAAARRVWSSQASDARVAMPMLGASRSCMSKLLPDTGSFLACSIRLRCDVPADCILVETHAGLLR